MSNKEVLFCICESREHQIIFEYDDEINSIYCSIHLTKQKFWKRLKKGIKYIFGYHCKYGHWDEFILDEKDCINLINKLMNEKKH